MMKRCWWLLLCFSCGGASEEVGSTEDPGANDPGSASPWFVEESRSRGLVFEHVVSLARRGEWHMPDMVSGGGAAIDVERDGDLDLYLVQSGDFPTPDPELVNRFFLNDGRANFTDATDRYGAADGSLGMGAAVGDIDGDGFEDLLVTNYGPDTMWLNRGGERFERHEDAALAGDDLSSSALFFDADQDGDLDAFVLRYLLWDFENPDVCHGKRGGRDYCGPKSINTPLPDRFLVNDGQGHFTDESVAAGIDTAVGSGLGVLAGDFDDDGLQDIFVANDGWPDRLWRNEGGNRFVDIAMRMGCAVDETGFRKAGMGVTACDVDDDGDLDLAVCNLGGETDAMFRNQGAYFQDMTARLGVANKTKTFTRFGMGWIDFDNDGRVDLYQANGCVQRPDVSQSEADPYAEHNVVMKGDAEGRFTLVEPVGGTAERLVHTSRGAIFGDFDNDGGQDVVVVNRDSDTYLLRNVVRSRGGWILFDVREANGRVALGARVSAKVGDRTLTRDVRSGYSYVTGNSPRVHLGLGTEARASEVRVTWVDGTVETFGAFDGGKIVPLTRGSGTK